MAPASRGVFCLMSFRGVTEWTSHTALRRGIQGYPFMSFRAVTRYPEIPAKAGTRKRHFTGPRIECGVCSFFSAARRTNQEAPPLLSGFVGRRLAPSSGAAELAALRQSSPSLLGRLASSRPDKGGVYRYDAEAWAYCTWRGVDVIPRPRRCHTAPQEYPFMSYRAATRYPGRAGRGLPKCPRRESDKMAPTAKIRHENGGGAIPGY